MALAQISEEHLRAARSHALIQLQDIPFKEPEAHKPLETFLGVYHAARAATGNHDLSVYTAAQEAMRHVKTEPLLARYPYPETPKELLSGWDTKNSIVAGYLGNCSRRAKSRLSETCLNENSGLEFSGVIIEGRTYNVPIREKISSELPALIGLDSERALMQKYVRQLFLYDAEKQINPDKGRFPETILLVGPAGTGKSSLLRYANIIGKEAANKTKLPFHFETYDASNFSSYFGQSTRLLKKCLERARNPVGVGIFCIEDADMILQSRDETHRSKGVMEIQQYLMNTLSGVNNSLGNTLTILTSNKPTDLDEALRSRMAKNFLINPFAHKSVHETYWRVNIEGLSERAAHELALASHSGALTGRDLASIVTLARENATRAPTLDELARKNKLNHSLRHGKIESQALAALIAERTAARHKS